MSVTKELSNKEKRQIACKADIVLTLANLNNPSSGLSLKTSERTFKMASKKNKRGG